MSMTKIAFAGALGCAVLAGSALAQQALPIPPLQHAVPSDGLNAAQMRGQDVFRTTCEHCHGPGRGMPGTSSLAVKYQDTAPAIPALIEERTDLTPELVEFFVRNGSGAMAPYRKTEVSDDQLADLAAYLSRPRP